MKNLVGPANWIKNSMVRHTMPLCIQNQNNVHISTIKRQFMYSYLYNICCMYTLFTFCTFYVCKCMIIVQNVHACICVQVPFKTIGGRRKSNVADWLAFLRSSVPYVFGNVGPIHPQESYFGMIDLLKTLVDATADFDPDDDPAEADEESRRLHLQAIEALCVLEKDFPLTEMAIFLHEILHVPEFIYRWNGVRNYWCFACERFVGWMKGFVKNRSLSVENMVHFAYISVHVVHIMCTFCIPCRRFVCMLSKLCIHYVYIMYFSVCNSCCYLCRFVPTVGAWWCGQCTLIHGSSSSNVWVSLR
jgi:hypothetical protein